MPHLYSNILGILAGEMQAAGIPGVTAENLIVDEVQALNSLYEPADEPNTEIAFRTTDDTAQGTFRYSRVPATHAFFNGTQWASIGFDENTPRAEILLLLSQATGCHFDESDIGQSTVSWDVNDACYAFEFQISSSSLRYFYPDAIRFYDRKLSNDGGSTYVPMEAPAVATTMVYHDNYVHESSYYPSYVMLDPTEYTVVDSGRTYIDATLYFQDSSTGTDGYNVTVALDLIGPDGRMMVIAGVQEEVLADSLVRSFRTEVPPTWDLGTGEWKLRLSGRRKTLSIIPYIPATPADKFVPPYENPRGVRVQPGVDVAANAHTLKEFVDAPTVNELVSQELSLDNEPEPLNFWHLYAKDPQSGTGYSRGNVEFSPLLHPAELVNPSETSISSQPYIEMLDDIGLTTGRVLKFRTARSYYAPDMATGAIGAGAEVARFLDQGKIYFQVRIAKVASYEILSYYNLKEMPVIASGLAANMNDPDGTWHEHTVSLPPELRDQYLGGHRVIIVFSSPEMKAVTDQNYIATRAVGCLFDPSHRTP